MEELEQKLEQQQEQLEQEQQEQQQKKEEEQERAENKEEVVLPRTMPSPTAGARAALGDDSVLEEKKAATMIAGEAMGKEKEQEEEETGLSASVSPPIALSSSFRNVLDSAEPPRVMIATTTTAAPMGAEIERKDARERSRLHPNSSETSTISQDSGSKRSSSLERAAGAANSRSSQQQQQAPLFGKQASQNMPAQQQGRGPNPKSTSGVSKFMGGWLKNTTEILTHGMEAISTAKTHIRPTDQHPQPQPRDLKRRSSAESAGSSPPISIPGSGTPPLPPTLPSPKNNQATKAKAVVESVSIGSVESALSGVKSTPMEVGSSSSIPATSETLGVAGNQNRKKKVALLDLAKAGKDQFKKYGEKIAGKAASTYHNIQGILDEHDDSFDKEMDEANEDEDDGTDDQNLEDAEDDPDTSEEGDDSIVGGNESNLSDDDNNVSEVGAKESTTSPRSVTRGEAALTGASLESQTFSATNASDVKKRKTKSDQIGVLHVHIPQCRQLFAVYTGFGLTRNVCKPFVITTLESKTKHSLPGEEASLSQVTTEANLGDGTKDKDKKVRGTFNWVDATWDFPVTDLLADLRIIVGYERSYSRKSTSLGTVILPLRALLPSVKRALPKWVEENILPPQMLPAFSLSPNDSQKIDAWFELFPSLPRNRPKFRPAAPMIPSTGMNRPVKKRGFIHVQCTLELFQSPDTFGGLMSQFHNLAFQPQYLRLKERKYESEDSTSEKKLFSKAFGILQATRETRRNMSRVSRAWTYLYTVYFLMPLVWIEYGRSWKVPSHSAGMIAIAYYMCMWMPTWQIPLIPFLLLSFMSLQYIPSRRQSAPPQLIVVWNDEIIDPEKGFSYVQMTESAARYMDALQERAGHMADMLERWCNVLEFKNDRVTFLVLFASLCFGIFFSFLWICIQYFESFFGAPGLVSFLVATFILLPDDARQLLRKIHILLIGPPRIFAYLRETYSRLRGWSMVPSSDEFGHQYITSLQLQKGSASEPPAILSAMQPQPSKEIPKLAPPPAAPAVAAPVAVPTPTPDSQTVTGIKASMTAKLISRASSSASRTVAVVRRHTRAGSTSSGTEKRTSRTSSIESDALPEESVELLERNSDSVIVEDDESEYRNASIGSQEEAAGTSTTPPPLQLKALEMIGQSRNDVSVSSTRIEETTIDRAPSASADVEKILKEIFDGTGT